MGLDKLPLGGEERYKLMMRLTVPPVMLATPENAMRRAETLLSSFMCPSSRPPKEVELKDLNA